MLSNLISYSLFFHLEVNRCILRFEIANKWIKALLLFGADNSRDDEGKKAANRIEETKSLPAPVIAAIWDSDILFGRVGEQPDDCEGEEVLDHETPVKNEGLNPPLLDAFAA